MIEFFLFIIAVCLIVLAINASIFAFHADKATGDLARIEIVLNHIYFQQCEDLVTKERLRLRLEEVTPAMIRAGADALRDNNWSYPDSAKKVYHAMLMARAKPGEPKP